ncbi:LOW QUALITY PROTEIN: hypothetical protein ACHAWF_004593 [Thalassiosira exigua]
MSRKSMTASTESSCFLNERIGSCVCSERSNWTHQAKLLAPDGGAHDIFGNGVGVHDDTAIVGASSDDDKGQKSASAHVFVRGGVSWTHQAKLLAPDGDEEDRFRNSVGVYGNTAIVDMTTTDSTAGRLMSMFAMGWGGLIKKSSWPPTEPLRIGWVQALESTIRLW